MAPFRVARAVASWEQDVLGRITAKRAQSPEAVHQFLLECRTRSHEVVLLALSLGLFRLAGADDHTIALCDGALVFVGTSRELRAWRRQRTADVSDWVDAYALHPTYHTPEGDQREEA